MSIVRGREDGERVTGRRSATSGEREIEREKERKREKESGRAAGRDEQGEGNRGK